MNRQTMTVTEAAAYIGISKDLVYQLVREQKLPHVRVGQRILLRKQTLDHWIDKQERGSIKQNNDNS